jgi:hypothetical protein
MGITLAQLLERKKRSQSTIYVSKVETHFSRQLNRTTFEDAHCGFFHVQNLKPIMPTAFQD